MDNNFPAHDHGDEPGDSKVSLSADQHPILSLANQLRVLIEKKDSLAVVDQFLTPTVVSLLKSTIVSPLPSLQKHAVYILKSLTSFFLHADPSGIPPEKAATIQLQNGKSDFKNFWTDFFDLFDIFDEKQYHIISPFLAKLRSPRFESLETTPWLTILVEKLLAHDNRMLAKEGLNVLLDHGLSLSRKKLRIPGYLDFIQEKLFPVLKDRVGWILPDPEDLFKVGEKLGLLVSALEESPSESPILGLIQNADTDLSPVATYFFALAGFYSLQGERKEDSAEVALKRLGSNLKILNYCIQYRLTAIDKFLKIKIQQLFIDTVFSLWNQVPDLAPDSQYTCLHLSNYERTSKLSKSFQGIYPEFLFFWSALDVSLLLPSVAKVRAHLFKDDVNNDWLLLKDWKTVHSIFHQVSSCRLRTKGFFRWLLFHVVPTPRDKSLKHENLGQLVQELIGNKLKYPLEYSTDSFETLVDFSSFLVSIYPENSELLEDVISRIAQHSTYGILTLVDKLNMDEVKKGPFFERILPLIQIARMTRPLHKIKSINQQLTGKFKELLNTKPLLSDPCNAVVLALLLNYFPRDGKVPQETLDLVMTTLVEGPLPRDEAAGGRNNNNKELSRKYNGLRLLAIKELLQEIQDDDYSSEQQLKQLLDLGSEVVETGSSEHLASVINIIEIASRRSFVFSYGTQVSAAADQIQSLWKAVKDLHKTEHFWDAFNAFAALISAPCFSGIGILTKYSALSLELSESISGLPLLLIEQLSKIPLQELIADPRYKEFLKEFLELNIQASCFGPIMPKSMKLTFNIWEYLCSAEAGEDQSLNYDKKLSFPFNGTAKGRLLGTLNIIRYIKTVSSSSSSDNSSSALLPSIVKSLLELNEGDTVDKRRYFTGSYVHRFKQRVVQVLLVLQPFFDLDLSREVMKTLLLSLGRDGPQASVRYITEWIIINSLIKYPELHSEFFELCIQCFQLRPGFGCLFATMVLHTSSALEQGAPETEKFYDVALQNLTGLLMGQNFTVRIYGNIALCNMYDRAVEYNLGSIISKYQVIYTCAKDAVATAAGNFKKIFENVTNDFYLKFFSPRDHYYFDVIFIHLPKIAKMCSDEIIHEVDLQEVCRAAGDLNLKLCSATEIQNLYKDDKEYSWHLKSNLIDGREHGEEHSEATELPESGGGGGGNVLQVKGNPWKYLPVAEELFDFPEEIQLKKKSREDGLVVVASLIDRIPNLGGLCRTCEVFGASKYIISSLKILDDQQFKSLSVSAHRWVDILEVPVQDLRQLLSSYSAKGYTVVGVEQALESTTLNNFAFPKKTLLLLGNEKYGIPSDLLGLVDNCIEIPQVGLIRSLNVHVTGALCIWHYASQHVI